VVEPVAVHNLQLHLRVVRAVEAGIVAIARAKIRAVDHLPNLVLLPIRAQITQSQSEQVRQVLFIRL
jgi:hypothetical protein